MARRETQRKLLLHLSRENIRELLICHLLLVNNIYSYPICHRFAFMAVFAESTTVGV